MAGSKTGTAASFWLMPIQICVSHGVAGSCLVRCIILFGSTARPECTRESCPVIPRPMAAFVCQKRKRSPFSMPSKSVPRSRFSAGPRGFGSRSKRVSSKCLRDFGLAIERDTTPHRGGGAEGPGDPGHLQTARDRVHSPLRCEFLNVAPLVPGSPSLDVKPCSPGGTRRSGRIKIFEFRFSIGPRVNPRLHLRSRMKIEINSYASSLRSF